MTAICSACQFPIETKTWPPAPCQCGGTEFTQLEPDPPRVSYTITANDRRFLRSLRISSSEEVEG